MPSVKRLLFRKIVVLPVSGYEPLPWAGSLIRSGGAPA
jgi:hypothetical protein